MEEPGREFVDLKREIVETRNQVIKTDNQMKNLSLDVKNFERRFESLERRARVASLGAHVIVAVAIAGAAYFIYTARSRSLLEDVARAATEAAATKNAAEAKAEELRQRLADLEQERHRHDEAAQWTARMVDHLDAGREKDAIDALEKLKVAHLDELERKLVDKRISELQKRAAEAALTNAKKLIAASRSEAAVEELRRAIAFERDERQAQSNRYLLASTLLSVNRAEQADAALRELARGTVDKALHEDVRYLQALVWARADKRAEAAKLAGEIVAAKGKYAGAAKALQTSLEPGAGDAPTATAAAPANPGAPTTSGAPPASTPITPAASGTQAAPAPPARPN